MVVLDTLPLVVAHVDCVRAKEREALAAWWESQRLGMEKRGISFPK